MLNEELQTLNTLVAVALGGAITLVGQVLTNRQHRRNELNRLIQTKRVSVYEELKGKIEYFGMGLVESGDYKEKRYPLIFDDPYKLSDWRIGLIVLRTTSSHLIDSNLGYELQVLDEYLMRVESLIAQCKLENGNYDMRCIRDLGQKLYPDFLILKRRTLLHISKFFSDDMHKTRFKTELCARYDFPIQLPEFFKEFELIKMTGAKWTVTKD